jgi:uncharacterized protein (TIGR02328 family)
MRCWHYKLIPVLPNAMLVSQWRECIAIKRQWEKGTLKHRLVSYVMDYNKQYFLNYVVRVTIEMSSRNMNWNRKFLDEIYEFCNFPTYITGENYNEHNNRYLKQCYYNLQEKYDRGIITKEEWQKIEDLFKEDK